MYCTKCGTRNDDSANTCIQCGNALRPASFGTPVTPPSATPPPPPQAPVPPVPQYQAPIAQAYTQPPPQQIPNYLVQAILVTVFCCLPFGIASIVFAAQVNGKVAAGDIQGALQSSKQAKTFAWVAFGCGALVMGGYAIFMVLVMAGAIASGAHAH